MIHKTKLLPINKEANKINIRSKSNHYHLHNQFVHVVTAQTSHLHLAVNLVIWAYQATVCASKAYFFMNDLLRVYDLESLLDCPVAYIVP